MMRRLLLFTILLWVGLGCDEQPPASIVVEPTQINIVPTIAYAEATQPPISAATTTPLSTDTPIPLAVQINGVAIEFATYERELAKYRQWYPNGAPDGRDLRVYTMELMIEQELAKQGLAVANRPVDSVLIDQHVVDGIQANGGAEGFNVWLDQNGFADEAAYREQVGRELSPQFMMGMLGENLPQEAERLRARYIEVTDAVLAQQVKAELDGGADFVSLVYQYSIDPEKERFNGDLGEFTRGTLFVPEIETAAFALDLFEISDVIVTAENQYFIIQLTEKEGNVPLSEQAKESLIQERYAAWLAEQKSTADIAVYVGFD